MSTNFRMCLYDFIKTTVLTHIGSSILNKSTHPSGRLYKKTETEIQYSRKKNMLCLLTDYVKSKTTTINCILQKKCQDTM